MLKSLRHDTVENTTERRRKRLLIIPGKCIHTEDFYVQPSTRVTLNVNKISKKRSKSVTSSDSELSEELLNDESSVGLEEFDVSQNEFANAEITTVLNKSLQVLDWIATKKLKDFLLGK